MCSPSPVASKCWLEVDRVWPEVTYLGIVGDQAHQTRVSGHNCGALQESSLINPATGLLTAYPDQYAHALDIGHGGNRSLATEIRTRLLADPQKRVRYVIDNGTIYYPEWRGGGTSSGSGHSEHLHVSFTPWSTYNVSSWFGPPPTAFPLKPGDHGFPVLLLEITLVHCGFDDIVVSGGYGPRVLEASQEMQRFLRRPVRPVTTEGDFEAFHRWDRLTEKAPGRVLTINDQGPLVTELRQNLRKLGKRVASKGKYDRKVQTAMTEVQRFFNLGSTAGNASRSDRQFVRYLASMR